MFDIILVVAGIIVLIGNAELVYKYINGKKLILGWVDCGLIISLPFAIFNLYYIFFR